jgi:hypothetical protein
MSRAFRTRPPIALLVAAVLMAAAAPRAVRAQQAASASVLANVSHATIRSWIEKYQPALLTSDSVNYIGFAVDEAGNVVHSALGYDAGLNERLATIVAARARLLETSPDAVRPTEIHLTGRAVSGAAPASDKTSLIPLLHGPGEEIRSMEGMNTFAGEVIDRPLEVLILFVKKN